jgi:Tfp pilus assembly protein PilX
MSRHTISTSHASGRPLARGDQGVALITTLLLMGLLSAIGLGLTMLTMVETWLGAGIRTSQVLAYAADAGIARVQVDLTQAADWSPLLAASASGAGSAFNDGATRAVLADGSVIDLSAETRRVQSTSDLLYGSASANADSPSWRLFAHGAVTDLVPGRVADTPVYLAAWIADDPSDGDGDPSTDGNGRLMIRATAFGVGGARRSVEATVVRAGPPGSAGRPSAVKMIAWRELR